MGWNKFLCDLVLRYIVLSFFLSFFLSLWARAGCVAGRGVRVAWGWVGGFVVRGYIGNKVHYILHVTLIQGNRNKPSVGSEGFTELQEEQHIQRVCV